MDNQERITNWINLILNELSELNNNKGIEILNTCGSSCCEISQLFENAVKVRNELAPLDDTDKLFNAFKQQYFNTPKLDKKNDQITLIFEECTCPMVKAGVNNPFLCNCTIGYTKKIFETLFDKTVEVELKKSILQGDKICEQHIRVCE